MRILIDTNIIVSAAIFPHGRISALMKEIIREHEIYICAFSLEELAYLVNAKFRKYKNDVDTFLNELAYVFVRSPFVLRESEVPVIRDPDDYPILLSAIDADVDVLLSGDKDFYGVDCERPEILSPSAFREKYL